MKVYAQHELQTARVILRKPIEYRPGLFVFGLVDATTKEYLMLRLNAWRIVWIDGRGMRVREEVGGGISALRAFQTRVIGNIQSHPTHRHKTNDRVEAVCAMNDTLTFFDIRWEDVTCFDYEYRALPRERLEKHDLLDVIVYPRNVWINDNRMGITVRLAQIRRREPLGIPRSLFGGSFPAAPPAPPPPSIKTAQTMVRAVVRPTLADILKGKKALRITSTVAK
jgi:hypothetical protein